MSRTSFRIFCLLSMSLMCTCLPTTTKDEAPVKTEAAIAPAKTEAAIAPAKTEAASAPKITYSKETVTTPGETVTLDCAVEGVDLSGLKDFQLIWSKIDQDTDTKKVMVISSNDVLGVISDKYEIVHPADTYQYSLKMKAVEEHDTGMYRCTVDFGGGQKIDADVPVLVQTPAYFNDEITKTIRVTEGDAISIDCQPGGVPAPDVYWQRVDEKVPFDEEKYFKANKLELPQVHRSHEGRYNCFADNGLGTPVQSEIIIEVEYKPTVEVLIDLIPAAVFEKVQLSCSAEGNPKPEISWLKDGQAVISTANYRIKADPEEPKKKVGSSLEILEVQVEDFAQYSCSAANSLGTDEKFIALKMKTPPSIVKQARRELVYELKSIEKGRDALPVAIECEASGVPHPTFQWTKDSKILDWESDIRMSLEPGTGTLLIKDPTMADNGVYQCYARNELGLASADKVSVFNSSVIEFIRKEPGDVIHEAELGRPFQLKCPKVIGYPKPELVWMKSRDVEGGIEMEFISSDRVVADPEGSLWFTHITEEDDTEINKFKYTCLATSELHPQDISLAKTITLNTVPPADGELNINNELINIESFSMYTSPKNELFKSFETNRLWCIFGGEPHPHVTWSRLDGKEMDATRVFVENNGQTLVFKDTQSADAGEYQCNAGNGIGTPKSMAITVEVDVVPKFLQDLSEQAQVIQEGTSVTFTCAIYGDAKDTKFEWYYNSRPLKIVQGSKKKIEGENLIISSATVADIGNYACKASNKIGYAYGQTTLSVIPKSPTKTADYVGFKTLEDKVDTLTVDVQKLSEIVQETVNSIQLRQDITDLLQKIADKVLVSTETETVAVETKLETETPVEEVKVETVMEEKPAEEKTKIEPEQVEAKPFETPEKPVEPAKKTQT